VDRVEQLISGFTHKEQLEGEGWVEQNQLNAIIELSRSNDHRVLPFFLEVLQNEMANYLVRIQILKALRSGSHSAEDHFRIGQAVQQVLMFNEDNDVRIYAAETSARYLDVLDTQQIAQRIVLDQEDDEDVRIGVFTALEKLGPTRQTIDLMRELLSDDILAKYAQRVLNDWSTPH